MAIHFRLDINELRPLGRTARGVKSMNLRKGDNLVSMDVLTSDLVDQLAKNDHLSKEIDENLEVNSTEGCLLYTSPSPRDTILSRMPSSA